MEHFQTFDFAKKTVGKVRSDFPARQLELSGSYFEFPQDQSRRHTTYFMKSVWEEGDS
jgi:hypothetical protein